MNEQMQSLFHEYMNGPKSGKSEIWQEKRFLTTDYIPELLPYRSDHLRQLMRYFKGIFQPPQQVDSPFRQTVVLFGESGSGKTVTAKRFGMELEQLALKKLNGMDFRFRHVNCRRHRTVFSVLVALMKTFIPDFPQRGFASAELIRMLQSILEQTGTYLLLALDELDFLAGDSELGTFLYSLSRLQDELLQPNPNCRRISLLLISKNKTMFDQLDTSVQASLSQNYLYFSPYTTSEIKSILQYRVHAGFSSSEFVPDGVLTYIAEQAGSTGDMRFGLDLLRCASHIADQEQIPNITQEIVDRALQIVFPVKPTIIFDLPVPQKVILLSIVQILISFPSKDYVTLLDIKKQYLAICNNYKLKIGRGNTILWNHLQTLKSLNIVKAEVVSKNVRGRFTKITLKLPQQLIMQNIERDVKKFARLRS